MATLLSPGRNVVDVAARKCKRFCNCYGHHFDDLKKFGSETEIKKQGKLRLEGKDYAVVDGDILHILFSV